MRTAIYSHACPVCLRVEENILGALDKYLYEVFVVRLGETPDRHRAG